MSRTLYYALLAIVTLAIWLPVLIVTNPHSGDFQSYVDYARILGAGRVPVPHLAYPLYLLIVSFIVGWDATSLITALLFAVATSLCYFLYYRSRCWTVSKQFRTLSHE